MPDPEDRTVTTAMTPLLAAATGGEWFATDVTREP